MGQNRCTHLQDAPAKARPRAQRRTVAQSLTNRRMEPQVRGLFGTEQRLKRLKLAIYDAHTRSHAHARMSPYT